MKVSFDPVVSLPQVDSGLQAVAVALVATVPELRIQRISLAGQTAWLKRAHRQPVGIRSALRALLVSTGLAASRWLTLPEGGPSQLEREARRITWLHAQGVAVPAVLAHGPGWLILEDRGVSARDLIPRLALEGRLPVLQGILDDMVTLHALGVWHGGGQIKNTTLDADLRSLIDFEDGFGDDADLLDLQARDLFLLLTSCADWVPASTLREFAQHYATRGNGQAVADRARQTSAFLNRTWTRWLPGGDMRRARAAARALQSVS